jgi:hypothetical protein
MAGVFVVDEFLYVYVCVCVCVCVYICIYIYIYRVTWLACLWWTSS